MRFLGSLLFKSNGGKAEATHGSMYHHHHHHSHLNRDDFIHLYKETTSQKKPWLGWIDSSWESGKLLHNQSWGGSDGSHWGFCLTNVYWGVTARAAPSTNECKNNWIIWRGSFLCSAPPWPSLSTVTGECASDGLMAACGRHRALLSLHLAFRSMCCLVLVLLNRRFRVSSSEVWRGKRHMMQLLQKVT